MHQAEHNIGDHEDPAIGQTWLVSLVGTALLIVIFLGLTALYYNYANTESEIKLLDRQPAEFEHLHAAHVAQLSGSPRWEEREVPNPDDPDKPLLEQHFVIPIDQAMDLVVKEYGQP